MNWLLVIDKNRVPDFCQHCAEGNVEWIPLYRDTIWEPQLVNSPICAKVSEEDSVYQRWLTEPQWASSGVVFAMPEHLDIFEQVSSLQANITVFDENQRQYLLRFYSPKTLLHLASLCDQTVLMSLLQTAHYAYISPAFSELSDATQLIFNPRKGTEVDTVYLPISIVEELLA